MSAEVLVFTQNPEISASCVKLDGGGGLLQSVCPVGPAGGIAPAPLMSQSPFITPCGCGGDGRTYRGGLLKCADKRINGITCVETQREGGRGGVGEQVET